MTGVARGARAYQGVSAGDFAPPPHDIFSLAKPGQARPPFRGGFGTVGLAMRILSRKSRTADA